MNYLSPEKKELLHKINISDDIVEIIGESFYILVPVESSTVKGSILEGAMIKMEPDGIGRY